MRYCYLFSQQYELYPPLACLVYMAIMYGVTRYDNGSVPLHFVCGLATGEFCRQQLVMSQDDGTYAPLTDTVC